MKKYLLITVILLIIISSGCIYNTNTPKNQTQKLQPPSQGVYHSAYPDFNDSEDVVTSDSIDKFENMVNKSIVWTPFSDNWGRSNINFPKSSVQVIHSQNVTPYIRLMPVKDVEGSHEAKQADPVYNLQNIIDGKFDEKLRMYARDTKNSGVPIIIDFAPEMNGDWFSWSGKYNGGSIKDKYGDPDLADGPERYRDAYRHIINIFREEGATDVTWVFHVNANSIPEESWNNYSAYYPGDEYIDWIGFSVYGPITPDDEWESFNQIMDTSYPQLEGLSPSKPLAVLEFGVMDKDSKKAEWLKEAFQSIESDKYPRIKAISYWNEAWENDDGSTSDLTLNSSQDVLNTYKSVIKSNYFVDKAVFSS
ncbi:glycoside hydrolase family 26 protein [Methanobacterium sp.]|uniref:glycoside hydrolase family 26 protein n=1 Tax=Methanobacterium sp. TaxID=2164 RepID=UPI003C790641